MRSKGVGVSGDLLIGAAGVAVANYAAGFVFDMPKYSFIGETVIAIIGEMLFVVVFQFDTNRRHTDVVTSQSAGTRSAFSTRRR
jgi:uncharacterized membrane protein YeaQ/YmgE (transglycosylase-associated protein family)